MPTISVGFTIEQLRAMDAAIGKGAAESREAFVASAVSVQLSKKKSAAHVKAAEAETSPESGVESKSSGTNGED